MPKFRYIGPRTIRGTHIVEVRMEGRTFEQRGADAVGLVRRPEALGDLPGHGRQVRVRKGVTILHVPDDDPFAAIAFRAARTKFEGLPMYEEIV